MTIEQNNSPCRVASDLELRFGEGSEEGSALSISGNTFFTTFSETQF